MPAQSHHLPTRIPFGVKSEALWSLAPNATAVIFVHGFGGSALTTWLQFPSLLHGHTSLHGHDVIFYGYDGLKTRARASGNAFMNFLDALLTNPTAIVRDSVPHSRRPDKFQYQKVIIVAHSLGAVVVRSALVDAYRKGHQWAPKTRLVLFAPAHCGANIIPLAALMMSALRLAPIEALARFRFQVLHDLDEKSTMLAQLSKQTDEAIRQGATNLVAQGVVYATNDKVVNPGDFCDDPSPDFIAGASHTSVCKPRPDFSEPLDYLLKYL